MAEQDINQTILDTLRGAAHEFGKMSSPTAGVDTKGSWLTMGKPSVSKFE